MTLVSGRKGFFSLKMSMLESSESDPDDSELTSLITCLFLLWNGSGFVLAPVGEKS